MGYAASIGDFLNFGSCCMKKLYDHVLVSLHYVRYTSHRQAVRVHYTSAYSGTADCSANQDVIVDTQERVNAVQVHALYNLVTLGKWSVYSVTFLCEFVHA